MSGCVRWGGGGEWVAWELRHGFCCAAAVAPPVPAYSAFPAPAQAPPTSRNKGTQEHWSKGASQGHGRHGVFSTQASAGRHITLTFNGQTLLGQQGVLRAQQLHIEPGLAGNDALPLAADGFSCVEAALGNLRRVVFGGVSCAWRGEGGK